MRIKIFQSHGFVVGKWGWKPDNLSPLLGRGITQRIYLYQIHLFIYIYIYICALQFSELLI